MSGRPILTAAEMRSAEARAVASGTSEQALMDRAGRAAAEAILRFAGPVPALVLCGPGNNGGDGYVIAEALAGAGATVQVAASAEPASPAARAARERWTGEVLGIEEAESRPLLVDALFGTGLSRPLEAELSERLCGLASAATVAVAVDLPSGVSSDDGAILSPVPRFDLTVTFATLKPAHLLQPAAAKMGRLVVADIGIEASGALVEIGRPRLEPPGPSDHKYSRGYVAVLAGEMPGAAALAATGALRSGAGYVRVVGDELVPAVPAAVVQGPAALDDPRIGCIVLGPGLGRGDKARELLRQGIGLEAPLVLDGDALTLASDDGPAFFQSARRPPVLTPHAAEFERLFGPGAGSKVERTRRAARSAQAVVVHKGADTVVAGPDGKAAILASATHWLATAGTGDVLAGVIGALRARGLGAFEAACAGVWLHARAGILAGPGLIADDLPHHLPAALEECL